ncbi:MAG: hypothetical protein F6K47_02095 [Symploca sp. SIO2E6]|nr:hypothetical protein [Symploca sp. SIO2E6]
MDKTGETIKGGVLLIGSLLWQDGSTQKPLDLVRKRWREAHLLMGDKQKVTAPIRYGSYSSPTDIPLPNELYTMVLSPDLDQGFSSPNMGEAYVIEFQQKLSCQDFTEQLKLEVKELSKAEGLFTSEDKFFKKTWGAISILINQDSLFTALITSAWVKAWREERDQPGQNYYQRFRQGRESPVISKDGILELNPFHPIDENTGVPSPQNIFDGEDGYDFILAVVTVPVNKGQRWGVAKL